MDKKMIGIIAGFIIIGSGAFYGGITYAKNKVPSFGNRNNFTAGQNMGLAQKGGRNIGGAATGEILSMDDKSLTIKLRDGGSKIVFLSSSTKISKEVTGAITDLNVGEQVITAGTPNSDGSINAQTVQIRPAPIATSTPSKK